MKSLFWLASYPKSGNTWLRAFLANYLFNPPRPVPVNKLHKLGAGDANALAFHRAIGRPVDPADPVETARNRAPFFDALVSNGADVNFVKTHNQNSDAFGIPLVPVHQTRCAIYVIRDPRDLVISYASHHGLTIDQTIDDIDNAENATKGDSSSVHQFLGRWSDHVSSWTRTKKFPVLTIRYEDMLTRPGKTFTSVVRRIGNMPLDKTRLDRAIEFSSFEQLKRQENVTGFIENSRHQDRFFRTGRAGHFREVLSADQIARVESSHGKVMRRHGYL